MKILIKSLLNILITTFLLIGCKQDRVILVSPQDILSDEVTPEFQEWYEQQPLVKPDLEKIKLPNGKTVLDFLNEKDPAFLQKLQNGDLKNGREANVMAESGPQDKKNLIISKMLAVGEWLANKDNHQYTDGDIPQKGLWYKWGGKNLGPSKTTSEGGICHLKTEFRGLDCSGMLLTMLRGAGLESDIIPNNQNAATQSEKSYWDNMLKKAGSEFKKVRVEVYEFGELIPSELQSGDIVFFRKIKADTNGNKKVYHVGVAYGEIGNGAFALLNSYGGPKSCKQNEERGPEALSIGEFSTQLPNTEIKVIRFTTDISGSYEIYLACASRTSEDARSTIKISIPDTDNKPFTAVGKGTDYSGTAFTTAISGIYDSKENNLSLSISIIFEGGEIREDKMETILQDETDWITTTKVKDNGGCIVAVKLKNLEK